METAKLIDTVKLCLTKRDKKHPDKEGKYPGQDQIISMDKARGFIDYYGKKNHISMEEKEKIKLELYWQAEEEKKLEQEYKKPPIKTIYDVAMTLTLKHPTSFESSQKTIWMQQQLGASIAKRFKKINHLFLGDPLIKVTEKTT